MHLERLEVFGCQDCIAGRERGHAPVWANDLGPTCDQMINDGRCGKALLAQLVAEGRVTVVVGAQVQEKGGPAGRL